MERIQALREEVASRHWLLGLCAHWEAGLVGHTSAQGPWGSFGRLPYYGTQYGEPTSAPPLGHLTDGVPPAWLAVP